MFIRGRVGLLVGAIGIMTFLLAALFAAPLNVRAWQPSVNRMTALANISETPSALWPMTVSLSETSVSKVYLPLVWRDPIPPLPSVYFDSFDDPASGWYTGPAWRYNKWCRYGDVDCHEGDEIVAVMSYSQFESNSTYRIEIPWTWHGGGDVDTWFVWPVLFAPLPESYYPLPQRYCIEARGVFANWLDQEYQPWWAHWGIVFGANAEMTEIYSFQVNANHDLAVLYHHNYSFPGNRQPLGGGIDINVETLIVPWSGDMPNLIPTHKFNTLKVIVDGHYVDIFVNGRHLNHVYLSIMPRERVGLIGGSWEVTPVDIQIDYFRYEPNCAP